MMRKTIVQLAAAMMVLSLAAPALAQNPAQIGRFKDWGNYTYRSKAGTVCYALSVALDKQPTNVDHGENFFMIARQPGRDAGLEPQLHAGYELLGTAGVLVTVEGRQFSMVSQGNRAWVEDAGEERQLVDLLRSARTMTVEAVSVRGTKTRYAYSLIGVSAALNAVSQCG